MARRPHVVYIHSHDTGRYVEPYGYPLATPHIANLAAQGVTFRQAFTAAPTCSPSRAALLTGQCPHRAGMFGLAHRGWALNDYSQHLQHFLKGHGYRTALAGIQHVAWHDESRTPAQIIGYDEDLGNNDVAEHVSAQFIKDHASSDQPFFLAVGFGQTHRTKDNTFGPPPENLQPQDPDAVRPPAVLPDNQMTRQDMAYYHDSAAHLDHRMGVVFKALQDAGILDDTLIICTTDHGIAFPHMKCNLTHHGTGVMMILRGPAPFAGGHVIDPMVSNIDIFPTICHWLDLTPPDYLEGKSMLPLIRGEVDQLHDEIFGEVTYHAGYEPMRSVRTQRYNYIRRFEGAWPKRPMSNCDDSLSKTLLLENGWADADVPEHALYDTLLDPNETDNLAQDPQHRDVLADMQQRLDAWMQRTEDPLLQGPIALRPGGVANPPQSISPKDTTNLIRG